MLHVLMAAVTVMVLLICANVSMMLLADAVTREQEVAVCAAIGASPGRLLREGLLEAALLVGAGAAASAQRGALAAHRAASPLANPRLH
jgi:hypothetical protein